MTEFERLYVLSVPFHNVTFAETVAWATDRMVRRLPGGIVVTPNLDFMFNVSRDRELRRCVYEADLVVADGMPAVWLSGLLGPRLKERVTGSDLTPALMRVCGEQGLSVFAIGGAPGVAEKALERMRSEHPGLKIAGTLSPPMGPFEKMDLQAIGQSVRKAAPHLVLVAMGMGKQEKLMQWLRANTDVPLMMGVGGSLDFLAGVQTRAPRWVQRLGLEWVWRLGTDPRRFIGRYFKDGVWLLSVLSKLSGVRLAAEALRRVRGLRGDLGGQVPGAIEGVEADTVLRFPKIETVDQQRAFLKEAGRCTWRYLDMRSRDWLNSLELGALAVMVLRRGSKPNVLIPDRILCRQLACLGLWEDVVENGGGEGRSFFREGKGGRRILMGVLFSVGLIGVCALTGLMVAGRFTGVIQRLVFSGGGAILLGYGFVRVGTAYVKCRRLNAAFACVRPCVVLEIGTDTLIQGCSGSLVDMFGFTPEEVMGHPVSKLFATDSRFNPDACEGELTGVRKSGQSFPLKYHVSKGDGVSGGAVVQICDITDRLRTERAANQMRKDCAMVAELYESLLDDSGLFSHARLVWRSWIRPGAIPGGDFMGCTLRNERQVDFVIGDVSGKSEAAVLLGVAFKYEVLRVVNEHVLTLFQNEMPSVLSLARMINTAIDRRLIKFGAYLTIGYFRFDFSAMAAEYVWRGAPPFFHWNKSTGQVQVVQGLGSAIGFQIRDLIQMETRPFASGDLFVFCSDGILFQRDATGEPLGADRISAAIEGSARGGDVQAVLKEIRSLCERWTGGGPSQDNMACLVTCIQDVK